MGEIPLGFSFEESDDGFILRNKNDVGAVTEVKISSEQVYALKATIDLWTDRKLSTFRVASDSVHPIVVHPVIKVGLWPDAVQENVLLTAETPSSGKMTLSVPLSEADVVALALPGLLAKMRAAENPTKQ